MKALVLAAGRGSRLRPYTDTRPKCLVPFADWPLLDWQVASLRAAGIDDIELVCGYRAEQLAGSGLRVWANPQWAETNMVHSLLCARETLVADDSILISYGDILYEPRLVEALIAAPDDIAVLVDRSWLQLAQIRSSDPLGDVETLRMDASGRILDLGAAPVSVDEVEAQYVGLLKFTAAGARTVIDFVDRAEEYPDWLNGRMLAKCDMTGMLRGLILNSVAVRAVVTDRGWCEFDTAQDMELYEQLRREERLQNFVDLPSHPGIWEREPDRGRHRC